MEAASLKAFELAKTDIFRRLNVDQATLVDLNGFENFVYGQGRRVIRITHESHRSEDQLNAELAFLDHLANRGASVARPIIHPNGEWVISLDEFHVCLFERIEGASMRTAGFSPALSRRWGQAIGGFHRLASSFAATAHRSTWREDENHQFTRRIPASQTLVLEQANQLMQTLEQLPTDIQHFGLIHSDAHAGNFLEKDGQLTFFDFDDCLYAWFGYDLATIIFGVALQKAVGDTEGERRQAVEVFLPHFLEGYAEENAISALLLSAMHPLMKLREFSLYAVIHAHMDPHDIRESYPRKFMQGRQARLEANLPFVDVNFEI